MSIFMCFLQGCTQNPESSQLKPASECEMGYEDWYETDKVVNSPSHKLGYVSHWSQKYWGYKGFQMNIQQVGGEGMEGDL